MTNFEWKLIFQPLSARVYVNLLEGNTNQTYDMGLKQHDCTKIGVTIVIWCKLYKLLRPETANNWSWGRIQKKRKDARSRQHDQSTICGKDFGEH